jgi:hypothetical protein
MKPPETSSNRFESNLSSPGVARIEFALKTDIFSICLDRSGSSNSSRSSTKELRLQHQVAAEAFGFLGLTRWLKKPPKPLATQIQGPKMKVMPSPSMLVVKLRDAIEFSSGCLMNTPT